MRALAILAVGAGLVMAVVGVVGLWAERRVWGRPRLRPGPLARTVGRRADGLAWWRRTRRG